MQKFNHLFQTARACLLAADVEEKLALTKEAARQWREKKITLQQEDAVEDINNPGRPARPNLVSPRELPVRKLSSEIGRAGFLHAIAHIEFNAINLAWDAVHRFRGLPADYYNDWVRVADEEATHFALLCDRLRTLGYDYGDFPAHNGLWEMAQKTAFDPLVRMALVPRVLEARGLDVTPGMMQRLKSVGDTESADVLEIILRDEIGHVEIGSRWFRYFCDQRGLEPDNTYKNLLQKYMTGKLKQPFNDEARKAAGFSEDELAFIHQLSDG
ncbi:MAG: ferritin-like domain-containing protein [Acidiferrobacterales bacterium]